MSAWIIRLCISALLLALIFYLVPFSDVWAAARQISPLLWLGALGLFLAGHAAAAAKWRMLIGGGISYRQAFRAHLGRACSQSRPAERRGRRRGAGRPCDEARKRQRAPGDGLGSRPADRYAGTGPDRFGLGLACMGASPEFRDLDGLAVAGVADCRGRRSRCGAGARPLRQQARAVGEAAAPADEDDPFGGGASAKSRPLARYA